MWHGSDTACPLRHCPAPFFSALKGGYLRQQHNDDCRSQTCDHCQEPHGDSLMQAVWVCERCVVYIKEAAVSVDLVHQVEQALQGSVRRKQFRNSTVEVASTAHWHSMTRRSERVREGRCLQGMMNPSPSVPSVCYTAADLRATRGQTGLDARVEVNLWWRLRFASPCTSPLAMGLARGCTRW